MYIFSQYFFEYLYSLLWLNYLIPSSAHQMSWNILHVLFKYVISGFNTVRPLNIYLGSWSSGTI